MPEVHVYMTEGRTQDQKIGMMRSITDALVDNLGCPRDVEHFHDWGEPLSAELAKLDPRDIVAFDLRFDALTDAAYRDDLWEAASLINGGASDDGFYYFCFIPGSGTLPDDFPYVRFHLVRFDVRAGTAQFAPGTLSPWHSK